jgi:hypothetical protein
MFSAVFNAGLDPAFPGQYFPTLVVQTEGQVHIAVMDPQPPLAEAASLVMRWLETHPQASGKHEVVSVGFLSALERMEVVERSTGNEKSFSGFIDWNRATVDWEA